MNAIKQTAIDQYNRNIADLQKHRDAVDLGHEWQDEMTGDRIFSFVRQATEVSLSLVLRATAKGATCERRVVGTKEVPLYEVVCQ